jgi:tetrahydromethanopterin S-methyltransferase subunit F
MAHREPEPQPSRPKGAALGFVVALVIVLAIVLAYLLLS